MTGRPTLAVTVGDPAGIGPLVTVAALQRLPELTRSHRIIVVGSPSELMRAAERVGVDWAPLHVERGAIGSTAIPAGRVAVLNVPGATERLATPGVPTRAGGREQLAAIDEAIGLVRDGLADAIVTGPVSKHAISMTGRAFVGHTEHLARAAGLSAEAVTMMFAGPSVRVSLVTTHLALAEVPRALTPARVADTVLRTIAALRRWWRLDRPRVVVLGLNPHAGEEGLFGHEESEVIGPALRAARERAREAVIDGPLPSETGLRGVVAGQWDCAVAHYHDQATIPCKLLDMGRSVNVTLGLPFLRTSVDHGVAYDAARTGRADPGSMVEALSLAGKLTAAERERR